MDGSKMYPSCAKYLQALDWSTTQNYTVYSQMPSIPKSVNGSIEKTATYAEDLAKENSEPICRPTLFHGRGIHKVQRPKLNRVKVRFRGQKLTINTARCGQPGNLARALRK